MRAMQDMKGLVMSTITIADVAPYFTQYETKYGSKCTLNLDLMEEIMGDASTDEEMLTAMHEAMTSEDEAPTKNDDRSHDDANESDIPVTSSAFEYADKMDDELVAALETNAKAALEGKRGGAVIAAKLIKLHGEDTIVNIWPVPGSEGENGTAMIGNRTADYYKTVVHKDDGTSAVGERSWYRDYLERSKVAAPTMLKLKSIKAVTANEQAKYILPEHEAVRGDKIKIKSKRSAIDSDLSNKKNAIVRAVNLIQRMHFLNHSTGMGCEIMLEDGQPAASNKLIQVWDKKDPRTGNALTIGQLLALKNLTEGATYQAIVGSTGRKAKAGQGVQVQNVKVETLPAFDDVTAEYAHFFERLRSDTKAMNAFLTHLNGAGSDDILLSLNGIMNDIDSYLSKPAYAKRLQGLLTAEREQSKVA